MSPSPSLSDYVSAVWIARKLGVHAATIRKWGEQGVLLPRPVRFSARCLRWKRAEVEALLERLAQEGAHAAAATR